MKIRYFPDTDTLYIELADRASSSSEAVSDHLIVDFDERGKPVGVTLEHYNPDQRQQHEPDPAADHPCALTGIKTSSIKVSSSTTLTLPPITPALQPGSRPAASSP